MDDEVIVSENIRTEDYRYIEVGADDGHVRLYAEDQREDEVGSVLLRLTPAEALDLMAALGQAVRAL